MPFIDILIFAIIAVFLIFRLRSILGNRDGFEQKNKNRFDASSGQAANKNDGQNNAQNNGGGQSNVVPIHGKNKSADGTGLAAVRNADPKFADDEFQQGAAGAFELILNSFATGDLSSLRRLLSFELYEEFAASIHERTKAGEQLGIIVHKIEDVELLNGYVSDLIASITVRFVSVQTRTLKDGDEKIIEEESCENAKMIDVWVFERDVQLNDPNWKLVESQAENEEETRERDGQKKDNEE